MDSTSEETTESLRHRGGKILSEGGIVLSPGILELTGNIVNLRTNSIKNLNPDSSCLGASVVNPPVAGVKNHKVTEAQRKGKF
jgi:hypothetical protein